MSDNTGINIQRQGIRESLSTPGVTPQLPTRPTPIGDALRSLLSQGAELARTGDYLIESKRRREERVAQIAEQQRVYDLRQAEQKDIRAYIESKAQGKPIPEMLTQKGHDLAFTDAANMKATTLDFGKLLDEKQDGEPIDALVVRKLDDLAYNMPDIFRATLRDRVLEGVSTENNKRQTREQAAAIDDLLQGRRVALATEPVDDKSADNLTFAIGAARKAGWSEDNILKATIGGAIADAANAGDVEQVTQLQTVLSEKYHRPDLAQGAVEAAQTKYAVTLRDDLLGQQIKNPNEARWNVQRAKSAFDNKKISADSYTQIVNTVQAKASEHLESVNKEAIMANQPVEPLWENVDIEFANGAINETQRTSQHELLYGLVIRQVKANVESDYLNTGLLAARTGDFASMQDLDVELPDGTHKKMTVADAWNKIEPMLVQEAQDAALRDLQSGKVKPKLGETPEDAGFRVTVQYHTATLAKNGLISQQFKNDLTQGMNAVSEKVVLVSGEAPPAFVRALKIWRAMAEHPSTADRHFGENVKSAEFYKQASRAYDNDPNMARTAMAMAQANQNAQRVAPISQDVITRLFTGKFDGVSNQAEMEKVASDAFRDFRTVNPQATPEVLMQKTLTHIATNYYPLDGGLYKNDSRSIPINAATIKAVKDKYADKYAEVERLSYDHLRLVPEGDQLVLMDDQTGVPWPVAHATESGIGTFSRAQITAIGAKVRFAEAEHERDLLAKDKLALALEPGKLGRAVQGTQAIEIQRRLDEARRAYEDGQYWKWWKIREKEHLKELGREIGGAAQIVWESPPVQAADIFLRGFGR